MSVEVNDYVKLITESADALMQTNLTEQQAHFIETIVLNTDYFYRVYQEVFGQPHIDMAYFRHQLGNPLTPMLGYSELLLDETMDRLTPKQRDYAQRIALSVHLLRDALNSATAAEV